MELGLILAVSAAVVRLVNHLKPLIHRITEDEEIRAAITLAVSSVLGLVFAAILQLNIAAAVEQIPLPAGILITGFVIGLGSSGIHAVSDFFNAIDEAQQRPAPTTATVTVETNSPSDEPSPQVDVGAQITTLPAVPTPPTHPHG